MNKYRDKSDFEINKAVAEITIYGDWYLSPTDERPFTFFNYGINSSKTVELPDYCNNPADAMPIFIDNKMGVIFLGDLVQISDFSGGTVNFGRNFYRTIAELFLMMKDAENEKI
ncbi:TPA: DUF2591 family protein [Morganella morganii]|nr:DUF2591 family protein [Morganella morganii]